MSGWALLLLVVVVCSILIYDVWDISRKEQKKRTDLIELIPVDKVLTSIGDAHSNGAGLRVLNSSDFDILECFGTLEDLKHVYIDNNKLVEENASSHLQLGLRVSENSDGLTKN